MDALTLLVLAALLAVVGFCLIWILPLLAAIAPIVIVALLVLWLFTALC